MPAPEDAGYDEVLEDLHLGSVYRNDAGHEVVIGENDTAAFQDSRGVWHVAVGIVWDAVRDPDFHPAPEK